MKGKMIRLTWPSKRISLMALAIIMLWLKTYITYKISFDIKIENAIQELILFINPLAFLMIVFGGSLFFKNKFKSGYILGASCLVSAILYGNVVYYREFTDFLTIPLLFQASNMGELGESIFHLLSPWDILFFLDVFVLVLLIKWKPAFVSATPYNKRKQKVYVLLVAAISFLNLGLAETERPQLLTRTFDREMLVKNIGTYNYHIYDAFLQSKSSAQRALADGTELADIENYVRANYKQENPAMFGAAKGKNVIMISMESTQNFVINETVNGQEITPFLNSFIKDSYYFNHFYHQVGQGKTSDSEFIVENSLYPLSRGAVFFTNPRNQYRATPEILNEAGYSTASLHANNKSFWNRDVMYGSLGYQRFYNIEDYTVNEENSVGWGLKDKDFFEQSIEHLKELEAKGKPFYAKFITLTNHYPFTLDEKDASIAPYDSNSKTLNQYFLTVRYMDEAIGHFIDLLKKEGLYDNSVIILYGDHYGISENHNAAMAQYLNKEEITPYDSAQLQKVPLIIHIPGHKGKVMTEVAGQVDLKPTLLHLLGIPTKDNIEFGADLFSKDRLGFTVFRDGSFITEDLTFTKDTCYSNVNGEPVEDAAACGPYEEKAKQELEFSDKIIYGDLLRFNENVKSP
ncbi:LTA synthase family protein [Bacillus testis]|uniref:LTA synthase family protein n=1 Tax=Bacillus testis TaxID=1622072 RepID=UPI000AA4738C|nr:LTA synthase family protein [Bacillus testis]